MQRSFVVLLAVSLVGLALASGATARQGIHVAGRYMVTDLGTTTCAPVAKSPFLLRCDVSGFVSQYSGDMTGTAVVDFTQIINCKTGRTNGRGVETFTGTIAGVGIGTLTWHDHFRDTTNCDTFEISDFALKAVLFSGTGALAGLNGRIDFTLDSYQGTLH